MILLPAISTDIDCFNGDLIYCNNRNRVIKKLALNLLVIEFMYTYLNVIHIPGIRFIIVYIHITILYFLSMCQITLQL